MPTWVDPTTWNITTGHVASQTDLQIVKDDLTFLGTKPAARAYNLVAISIANNTPTALTFDSERFDTDTIHDTVTNTSRLTCKTAGLYLIIGNIEYASNAAGVRDTQIRLNAVRTLVGDVRTSSNVGATSVSLSTLYQLAVNDYLELQATQNSGGALNVTAISTYSPEFAMIWQSN